MIVGLDIFKSHFKDYFDHFLLIGGTACWLAMDEVGLEFRATKDLDVVLSIEVLNHSFARAFWAFIKKGGYENRQKSTGKQLFYRFYSPSDSRYPQMIELFSRKPELIALNADSHLTPLPLDDEMYSLSAILLDDEYYQFIQGGKRIKGGLPVLAPEYIIPLKARAWIDLLTRSGSGDQIDQKNIKKHKNDILRLYPLLSKGNEIALSNAIKKDMQEFIHQMLQGPPIDLKPFGVQSTTFQEVLSNLNEMYVLARRD
jgi:hypothetical protein